MQKDGIDNDRGNEREAGEEEEEEGQDKEKEEEQEEEEEVKENKIIQKVRKDIMIFSNIIPIIVPFPTD